MRDFPRALHFAAEALQGFFAIRDLLGNDLQGYVLPQLQIACALDFSHSSFRQCPLNAKATRKHEPLAQEEVVAPVGGVWALQRKSGVGVAERDQTLDLFP
jgi:hypothetical protein